MQIRKGAIAIEAVIIIQALIILALLQKFVFNSHE
jgi:hypothetical protein